MLKVTITQGDRTWVQPIFVIDGHSHLGKDVDGAEMLNPSAPGKGTFDFWARTEGLIANEWLANGEQAFETTLGGQRTQLQFAFQKAPLLQGLLDVYEDLYPAGQFRGLREKYQHQNFFDMGVCFPFQDEFRGKMSEALYRASNTNVSRAVSRFPISLRMIGYMRCNPLEGPKAVAEVDYCAKNLAIRGLKLHPRSEGWVDSITSQEAIHVIARAAEYSFPVIFDTRGKQSILDIGELIKRARTYLKANAPHLVPQLKVLIGHVAQGNVDDEEVYRTICQPNTYGELSMLHGQGAGKFFQSFRQWFAQNNMETVDGRTWSEYLIFGSDYPYFGDQHAKNLLIYLFNKEFFDSGGTLADTANILGLNQLKVLPEYSKGYVSASPLTAATFLQATPSPGQPAPARQLALGTLIHLLESGKYDLRKVLPQFIRSFDAHSGEALVVLSKRSDPTVEIPVLLMDLVGADVAMLSVLPQAARWEPFGYSYFRPNHRHLFHTMFQRQYTAPDASVAANFLTQTLGE
jgi:predicted TIM-barrel fold metal-dependent hydrolase